MACVNRLNCYVCDRRFVLRQMVRIDGKDNANKCDISISRREALGHPPLEVNPPTRMCFACHQNILQEIRLIEDNPLCVRLNVLFQTRSSSCFICGAVDDIRRLSTEAKVEVFVQRNIFITENVRSCEFHLDQQGYILRPLLDGLRAVNRPCINQGPYLQSFLQGLRTVAQRRDRIEDGNSLSGQEFLVFISSPKPQSQELYSYCDPVPIRVAFDT
ncbi:hypothetical protein QAD02_012683 [Eretmocerus hayati]|uniref:Uncharacterized protein n=1 Tax=Eretmocerus hayati TaxID=131215 RepID=A0ACC2P0D9_9HYME|nr:hypothetical protein QAD02_012683 [Eretmocerus hayati]